MSPALKAKLAVWDFATFSQVDPLVWRTLEGWGVDFEAITNLAGPICLHSVTFVEGGGFEYDELGESAFVHVVIGEDAETELDVIAWSARDPFLFDTLLRQASLLGADRVLNPATYYGGRPCRLFRTLAWLQEGCEGAVVLEAIPASVTLAKAPGALAAEDLAHAKELIKSGAVKRDRLVVPADTVKAAA
jgi:hypothetical protein